MSMDDFWYCRYWDAFDNPNATEAIIDSIGTRIVSKLIDQIKFVNSHQYTWKMPVCKMDLYVVWCQMPYYYEVIF